MGADEEVGKQIAKVGNEFGSTTGRARRCGWLDLVALKRAVELNGVTGLALSKMDVLSGIPKLKLATHYEIEGKRSQDFPNFWHHAPQAIYEEVSGWEPFQGTQKESELPKAALAFVKRIEDYTGVPIVLISTGPERDQMIVRKKDL
jgi:adenylosuccinate synthase